MKRIATVLLAAGFAITLAGCTPQEVKVTVDTSTNTSAATSSDLTLVTLKVPNMF